MKWLSVDDELPESEGLYLIVREDKKVDLGRYAYPLKADKKHGYWWSDVRYPLNPTHWMPLPDLP